MIEIFSPTLRRIKAGVGAELSLRRANANERVTAIDQEVFYTNCFPASMRKYADHYRIRGNLMV